MRQAFRRGLLRRAVGTGAAISALLLASAGASQAATSVTVKDLNNGASADGLAESLAGGGVSISKVTYTGNSRAAGDFAEGASSIGFEDGVVLSSGKVQTYKSDPACQQGVEGPNTCYEETEAHSGGPEGTANNNELGEPGDTQLSELSGFETHDAAILEFDFVPEHSTVQFSYVFSSEEYSDFANTEFNDVFGFFVDEKNCALVPGTKEPVSVNTINDGNDEGGDTTPHHPELFRDNVNPKPTIDSQMDGLTTTLTCTATVTPGKTNHMKLAIADSSDEALDSAVFIEAGSLVSGTQISTTLSGGGQSGSEITVPSGTSVSDSATLSGADASKATGTVSYNVYSDNKCTDLVTSAGTVSVDGETVPSSEGKTLSSGTYYWQASYGGDANNNASKNACGSEVEVVSGGSNEEKPTTLTTSLSGGGQSGANITVPPGTAVSDAATLAGENASTATGSATYNVYSDNKCSKLVTSAGTVEVDGESVPSSEAKTLSPGTYYWQASYGGDAKNKASASQCGSEVETVSEEGEPEECTSAIGSARIRAGKLAMTVRNKLYTNLAEPQRFSFRFTRRQHLVLTQLTAASCRIVDGTKIFDGEGTATLNGVSGYTVRFSLRLSPRQRFGLRVRFHKGSHEHQRFIGTAKVLTSEVIS